MYFTILNITFSDEPVKTFTAENNIKAIAYFHDLYPNYSDDGGWKLCRSDNLLKTLASTEGEDYPDDREEKQYMNYA
jgi:hypothetical protein